MVGSATRQALQEAWTRRGPLAWLLWPASLLYRILWRLRQWLFRVGLRSVDRASVPVIVVGNVVTGGAGKTPMVIALVQHLQMLGLRPGVVSRGYGRITRDCRIVAADASPDDVGDEPLLIRRRTEAPVCVAATRIEAARALLVAHPELDLLICDDGLQHQALHRDIEVCVFDERGIGNGFLLPAGPLREPWPRRADLLVTSADRPFSSAFHHAHRTLASHAVRMDGSSLDLQTLMHSTVGQQARPIVAVAGTAQPHVFFHMLRSRGIVLADTRALPDHAPFDAVQWAGPADNTLLCTEKDAVKLWRHRPDALAVPLVVHLDPPFWTALRELLRLRGTPQIRAKLSSTHGHTPNATAGLPGHQGSP
jgi:tetraacyldisaccharide 4'-kinase